MNNSLHLQTTSSLFLHILTYFQKFSWPPVAVHRDSLLTLMTTFLFLLGSIGSLFLLKTVSCRFLPADFCIDVTDQTSCPHMQLICGRQVTNGSSQVKYEPCIISTAFSLKLISSLPNQFTVSRQDTFHSNMPTIDCSLMFHILCKNNLTLYNEFTLPICYSHMHSNSFYTCLNDFKKRQI